MKAFVNKTKRGISKKEVSLSSVLSNLCFSDRNNVNVIGPACIAQRLMFAAAAAAAAAPKESSNDDDSNFDFDEPVTADIEAAQQADSKENVTADSPTAEAVAKAFLESVDKYMTNQESHTEKEFSPKNGMSGVVVLGNGQIHRHYCENGNSKTNHNHIHTNASHQQAIEMVNIPSNETNEDDNVQVVLVAPRPRSLKRKNSRHKMTAHCQNGNVKLLSIESFRNGAGNMKKQQSIDITENQSRLPSIQRLLSIPDVLLNATMAHNANSVQHQVLHANGFHGVPRTRAVNMFVQREQVRPVYAPCHPCDLEGLQETAV